MCMPSCNTYHLTWVSLTLGMGYLFTAAPAKRSRCSLPWTRGISPFLGSPLSLVTLGTALLTHEEESEHVLAGSQYFQPLFLQGFLAAGRQQGGGDFQVLPFCQQGSSPRFCLRVSGSV